MSYVGSNRNLTSANPIDVAVVDASGNQITSFGGASGTVSSAQVSNVTSSASAVTINGSNSLRKGWACFNDSTSVLYLKFGSGALSTSFTVKIPADTYYEMPTPIYTGIIEGIWASANGAARVTEL